MYCCRKWFDIRKVVGINKGKYVCMKFNIGICVLRCKKNMIYLFIIFYFILLIYVILDVVFGMKMFCFF